MKKRADNLNFNFKEKNKKAQVTIIIIIAIVLIAVIILFFVFRTKILPTPESKISEVKDINRVLGNCIEQRAIDAIRLVGIGGGYTEPENNFEKTEFGRVSYGLKNNRNMLISLSKLENEISDYIKFVLPFCINEENYVGLTITKQDPEVETKINQDTVEVSANLPLSIIKDDKTVTLDNGYEIEISVRLGRILDITNQIIEKQKVSGDSVPLTFLSKFETETSFSYYDDNIILYVIFDEQSELEEIKYSFLFLAELEESEEE